VISALLAQSFGESVGINIDPYRISLKLPGRIDPTRIKKILTKTNPESLDYLLRAILKNSPSIRWELVHAARKFGALSKDFDYKNIGLRKIVDLFKEMPIFEEVINKIIWEKMDVENTKIVLKKIQNKEIKIFIQKISPISLIGCEAKRELIPPPQPDKIILKSLKKRLECTDILLFCMNCGHRWTTKVSRVDDQPRCPKCGAILIAGMRRYERGAIKIMKKKDRTKEEERIAKRIYKNACLVAEYGKFALLALAGRGIGEDSAARILAKRDKYKLIRFEEEEQKFLRDILNAELTYARTRGFWDR
jgi:ATP-dependent Lhr-like helicase